MMWLRLVRAELRKLTTTRMPWWFVGILALVSVATAIAIVFGTDMDGSKTFISTAEDQRSLLAFAWNATMGGALFGAIAVAREYGHATVVPTFLAAPRRGQAMSAQLAAVFVGGAALSALGGGFTVLAGVLALPATEHSFMLSAGTVTQLILASALAGALGAVLGGGLGAIVRNTGGAVTVVVFVLMVLPPILVQLASGAGDWIPATLAGVISGVEERPGVAAAMAALLAWALVPGAVGVVAVRRRDVI